MTLGWTQPLTEISTRNLLGGKGWPARKADNLIAICELIVIGNRTRDLLACSIVPQPATLPRAPLHAFCIFILCMGFSCLSCNFF
jgi:hypothetical protein